MNPSEQICIAVDALMNCFAVLGDTTNGTIYTNLCGQFPVKSYSGMQYLFVAYIYNINAILMQSMKSRANKHMVNFFKTYTIIYTSKIHHLPYIFWKMSALAQFNL